MSFEIGDKVFSNNFNYEICEFIARGGQGEIYKVVCDTTAFALKWYYSNSATNNQREIINNLINKGNINNCLVLPIEIVESNQIEDSFGYIMKFIPTNEYPLLSDIICDNVDIDISNLISVGILLIKSFGSLHSKGLCYSDISDKNIFIGPQSGDIFICDNDNIVVNNSDKMGVGGTQEFMAPEVIRGESNPTIETDRYSLAILLFKIFFRGHPLQGKKYTNTQVVDDETLRELYGVNPVFVYDPNDDSNRPDSSDLNNKNIENYWKIYPDFFKNLFIKSFTNGIRDSTSRITENEWITNLEKLTNWLT